VLKADSEATVETGTAKMSRVNRDIIGNFPAFNFHQERISKSASRLVGSTGSDRYSSNSVFVGSEFVFVEWIFMCNNHLGQTVSALCLIKDPCSKLGLTYKTETSNN
jgi:hypothetical protein